MFRLRTAFVPFLALLMLAGCERSPDDLEAWRNAEGGFEKMVEWATSSEESMEVRKRAVQILIEEHQPNRMQPLFEQIEDESTRQELVSGAVPTVEKMWAKNDLPKIGEKSESGLVEVSGESDSVTAKDAAYFLAPYAGEGDRKKLQAVMQEYMSKDQDIRTQLGSTTIGQLAGRAGEGAIDGMLAWVESTKNVAHVSRSIREGAEGDEKVLGALAESLRERAENQHPKLDPQLEVAILETKHPAIVPYVEKCAKDPDVPGKTADACMDVIARIQGPKATRFFAEMVSEMDGLMRWVAANRVVEIRGKPGVLVVAKALPLEKDSYAKPEGDSFKKDSEIFCNFVSTEMKELGVDSIDSTVKKALTSTRWPEQVIGLQCAKVTQATALREQVDALKSSKESIPGWGEDETTIGDLAEEVSSELPE